MLHSITDPRRTQGRRHDLPTLLTLAILALCSGSVSYLAMREWCENYQHQIVRFVPFLAGHTPNEATFHRVFTRLDEKSFEEIVGKWLQAIVPVAKGEGIALDGKSLHGTTFHLVAAFAHVAKGVLFEMGTEEKGKELVVGPEVLKHITITDHIVTGDALFAQKKLCEQIAKTDGGYVFRVKGNQAQLEKDIRDFFADPPFGILLHTYTSTKCWKGQKEERIVSVSSDKELLAYLAWPGLTHIWQMQKTVTKHGETTQELSVGIACIPEGLRKGNIAQQTLAYIQGHWSIENRLHRQKDMVFNEDKATIRTGNAPQVMSSLKNIVVSIFHRATVRNFKTAQRRFAAKPEELFTFLGLTQVQGAYAYA